MKIAGASQASQSGTDDNCIEHEVSSDYFELRLRSGPILGQDNPRFAHEDSGGTLGVWKWINLWAEI